MTTREFINKGTLANDGTGDTLRSGGIKIDNNFLRLWLWAGNDSNSLTQFISFDSDKIIFEGTTVDANYTSLAAINPTSIQSIFLPDASGNIVLDSATQTLSLKTLISPIVSNLQINDSDSGFKYIIQSRGNLSNNRNIFLPIISDSDEFILSNASQTISNKTIVEPDISLPRINTGINDVNGASIFSFVPTASAVLGFSITNAATAGVPILSVAGSDSNISAFFNSKNRGALRLSKGAYQKSTMSASGIISRNRSYINFNSGTPLAGTLSDGNVDGEFKKMTNTGAGLVTVTPTNFANGTSFDLAQNEGCEVIWSGSTWFIISNQSVLTIS